MTPNKDLDDSYFVSKSQRKRDSSALQDLGKALTEYPVARLAKVPMSDNLREALREWQRLSTHGARARHLQYIGKLMRSEEVEPIRAALEALSGNSRAETARMHRLERLREELLEDESVLTELGKQLPAEELSRLRQLRRNALKERAESRPPKAYREIFQILRALDEGSQQAEAASDAEDEGDDA